MAPLSKSLVALIVQRQAYQGGTFVENHVHKLDIISSHLLVLTTKTLLQPASTDTLLAGVMAASDQSSLAVPSQAVCHKFRETFLLFGNCHRIYNRTPPLTS